MRIILRACIYTRREPAQRTRKPTLPPAQLIACYHKEGVNHYQNCRKLAQEFVDLINKPNCGALTPAKTSDE